MAEGIASSKPPLGYSTKYVPVHNVVDPPNTWILAAVSGGILLLYSLSRIIAIQRRVRDLEARPPVDDIVMRGMIRQQVSEMVSDLEQSIRLRHSIEKKETKREVVVPIPPKVVESLPSKDVVKKVKAEEESKVTEAEVAAVAAPAIEVVNAVAPIPVEAAEIEIVSNVTPRKVSSTTKTTKPKKKTQE